MKLPKADINLPAIHKEYREYFLAADNIWNLCSLFIDETRRIGAGKEHYLIHCLTGAYTKQMRLFMSAYLLCREGLSQEAGIILRSMFETYIHLIALQKSNDSKEYARLWLVWEVVRDHVSYGEIKKQNKDFPAFPPELQDIVSKTESELGKNWKAFRKYGPAAENFENLCNRINMSGSYDTLYRITSKSTHASDLSFYSKPLDENGGISCQLSPEANNIESIIPSMVLLLRDSVIIINNLLELGNQKEIEELKRVVEAFILAEKERIALNLNPKQ